MKKEKKDGDEDEDEGEETEKRKKTKTNRPGRKSCRYPAVTSRIEYRSYSLVNKEAAQTVTAVCFQCAEDDQKADGFDQV